MTLRFDIPGRPVTWKRTVSIGKRRVTPAAMKAAKRHVQLRALQARPDGWPLDARYALEVVAHLANHAAEGDWDNYGKLISDALEGIAYRNDRQVDDARCRKVFGDGEPRTEIALDVLEDSA